jgi:HlyD family secretion protein
VRIRFTDIESFRPGMSVVATIETRTHTNAIAAPIASVTTRLLKPKPKTEPGAGKTNSVATNAVTTNTVITNMVVSASGETNATKDGKKPDNKNKPVEVLFVVEGDLVKAVPVKIGISDENYWEITDGLKEGEEVVTGDYRAISRDLDDGKKIVKGGAEDAAKPKP